MSIKRILVSVFFTGSLFFIFFNNFFTNCKYPSVILLAPNVINPVEKILAISFGARRLYSDILYIRFLQYYGTPEEGEWEFGEGRYPLLYPYSRDIAILDPYYTNAILVAGSSLAFGVKRINEAISLIKFALNYDRNNLKYITLLSAILTFEVRRNIYDEKLLEELYYFAKMENVPDMLRNVIAFLCRKTMRYEYAIELYELIIKESRDEFYIKNAKQQLDKLIQKRKLGKEI
jgi:tetratricopeptide (TPR) repeat protein